MDNKVINDKLDTLEYQLSNIKALLMGNGKIGIAEMARRAFEYMQTCKSTKNGLLDWAFRIMITTLMGYIAVRIGVKG